jgi:GR25 family glycosyltransferase involved in LPS biosynthesis
MLFDKICYINLDRRPDRNDHIIKTLKYLDLFDMSYKIEAIDGTILKPEQISNKLITQEGIFDAYESNIVDYKTLTPGGIGCALSHRKTYQYIIHNKINKCLILEDDCKINVDINKILDQIENKIPNNFDMLFLGYHVAYINKDIDDYYFIPDKVYGLFGYIVSLKGAKKLLEMFPLDLQIDTEISIHMNKFNAYCLKPEYHLIFSDPSSTTTQFGTNIQLREYFDIDLSLTNTDSILNITILILLVLIITILLIKIFKKINSLKIVV